MTTRIYEKRIVLLVLAAVLVAMPAVAAVPTSIDAPTLVDAAAALPLGGQLTVDLARADAPAPTLELTRVAVWSDDAEIVVHGEDGDVIHSAPQHAYFHGRISGDPGSRAALRLGRDGATRGMLTTGSGDLWLIDGKAGHPAAVRQMSSEVLASASQGFDCGNASAGDALSSPTHLETTLASILDQAKVKQAKAIGAPTYTARMAFETDSQYLDMFGDDAADAAEYLGDMVLFMSGVYSDEVDTSMIVSHLSLWQTNDPYVQNSSGCRLAEFGKYWNDNRTDIDRTLAHMINTGAGQSGIAWVGVLCRSAGNVNISGFCGDLPATDNYLGDYGYSGGISGSFDINNPQSVWDIIVLSHEIGHNFDSPHTHCYNSPVDNCHNGEAALGCYGGAQSLPCPTSGAGCGTIMSYCHLLSGGLGNISLTFGQGHPWGNQPERVPAMMNAHVVNRANAVPGCLAFTSESSIFADGFGGGNTGEWSEEIP